MTALTFHADSCLNFQAISKKKLQASSLYLNDHCAERAQNSDKIFIVKAGLINTKKHNHKYLKHYIGKRLGHFFFATDSSLWMSPYAKGNFKTFATNK